MGTSDHAEKYPRPPVTPSHLQKNVDVRTGNMEGETKPDSISGTEHHLDARSTATKSANLACKGYNTETSPMGIAELSFSRCKQLDYTRLICNRIH